MMRLSSFLVEHPIFCRSFAERPLGFRYGSRVDASILRVAKFRTFAPCGCYCWCSVIQIYVREVATDVGVFDDFIWIFDIESKTWVIEETSSQLSVFQRPFNRFGVRATQLGDTTWMWGGQILPGTRKVEFYSSVIGYSRKEKSMFFNKISGKTLS
eukprot:12890_6